MQITHDKNREDSRLDSENRSTKQHSDILRLKLLFKEYSSPFAVSKHPNRKELAAQFI
jgi:hypothetical protein